MKTFLDGRVTLHAGDCLSVVRCLADDSIDAVVTDPPYALVSIAKRFGKDGSAPAKSDGATGVYQRASSGFMGKTWDTGETAFAVEFWAEILRVLKPGGHVAAFGGTRSYHRLACAIEDAGFEIRDCIFWCFGTGFPKSHDVSKGIDKAAGAEREVVRHHIQSVQERKSGFAGEDKPFGAWQYDITAPATDAARQWEGWGTALKPAVEPVTLARKPLSEKTVAANVLRWGVGAINVDGCRIETDEDQRRPSRGGENGLAGSSTFKIRERHVEDQVKHAGRFPANLCLSWPEDEYELRPDVTKSQLYELSRWFHENP